jgi:hypothetical protein
MALIDPVEFEKGKAEAAEYWRRRGDDTAAAAFGRMALGGCRFGMDARARLAWARMEAVEVGLRFEIASGAYVGSFVRRPSRAQDRAHRSEH